VTKVKPYHPLLSNAYTQCTGKNPSTPPSPIKPLTAKELQYLKYWIHTGAKNSNICVTNICETLNLSFDGKVHPLLKTWCVGCDNTSNAAGGFDVCITHFWVDLVATFLNIRHQSCSLHSLFSKAELSV